ncbi:hypothetical protein [Streptomyces sp. NPDC054866]
MPELLPGEEDDVARNEPARMSVKAAAMPAVRGSERKATPAATATAGFT